MMNKPDKEKIASAAKLLVEHRKYLGLTQKVVAQRVGIPFQNYQRFEKGDRSILTASFDLSCRILNALELTPNDLLDRVGLHKEVAMNEEKEKVQAPQDAQSEYPLHRDLDSMYFRIERNGKWRDVSFCDMTFEEQTKIVDTMDADKLKTMCLNLAETLRYFADLYDISNYGTY